VPRFLSPEWFAALAELSPCHDDARHPDLVVEIAVSDTPEGEVRYQLVVKGDLARAVGGAPWPAQARVSSDYATFSGIASGRLSAYEALASGRAKFSGDTSALTALAQALAGGDIVPAELRACTTY
jgi:putative sterol carrier protein